MNLYSYCGNNPINWVDPWGLIRRIGIHSGSNHSWLSFEDDCTLTTFGLYAQSYGDRGIGYRLRPSTDVWYDNEKRYILDPDEFASRYIDATDEQTEKFCEFVIKKDHSYEWYWDNCTSWAEDGWKHVTGESLNVRAFFFFTKIPLTLRSSIRCANDRDSWREYIRNAIGYMESRIPHTRVEDLSVLTPNWQNDPPRSKKECKRQ